MTGYDVAVSRYALCYPRHVLYHFLYFTRACVWVVFVGVAACVAPEARAAPTLSEQLAAFNVRLNAAETILDDHRVRIEATDATFTGIGTSLAATDMSLEAQRATVTGHMGQLETHQTTLDEHGVRLDGHDSTLTEHGTRLGTMEATLQSHDSMFGEHGRRLDTQTQQAEEHATRLDDHSATLATHATRMDGHDATLQTHGASLASQEGRLDEQEQRGASVETRLEGQESRLARQTSRLDSQGAEVDGHGTQLEGHESRVGKLESDATQWESLLSAHSRRLAALEVSPGVIASRPLADGGDSVGMASLQGALATQQTALDGVGRDIEDLRSGVAMALALGGVAVAARGAFAIEVASGFYGTYSAVALQAGVRVTDWLIVDGGVAYGVDGEDFGGRFALRIVR